MQRARRWWGPDVTSIYDGSSTSARLTGMMWLAAYEECAQAEYTGIALEYGTVPILDLLDAMRADQWLQNHPSAPAEQRLAIKQRLRDAFYVDEATWKLQVLRAGLRCRAAGAGRTARALRDSRGGSDHGFGAGFGAGLAGGLGVVVGAGFAAGAAALASAS